VKSLNFDIDLAVISEKYFQLVSCGLDSPFKLDVADYNQLPEHIKKRVNNMGVLSSKTSLALLMAELNSDRENLESLFEKNRLVKKIEHSIPDEFDWAALGYTIHNVYNVMEKLKLIE
jgi:hypothetical protein